MRRKDMTLRGTLLELCRETIEKEGVGAVNIRSIAKRAGVAPGTVYNYFSSKDDILLALTEEYWRQTLAEMEHTVSSGPFSGQAEEIYWFLRDRLHQSAGALMASLSHVESTGQERMAAMQDALGRSLFSRLEKDPHIRKDIWGESFSKEGFVRFVLTHMLALLREKEPDPALFFAVVRRILYEEGVILDGTGHRGDDF